MKLFLSLFVVLLALTACNQQTEVIKKNQIPYVLLVSIDGFRWDYVDKYQPAFLSQWSKDSAKLQSLRPAFPTKTFPNHLSIITGDYPQHHGIIANYFYAPDIKQNYSLRDKDSVKNPAFYLSKPLWVLAQEQGINTASYFWPRSEAPIAGHTPSITIPYDQSIPHEIRIDKVISWFQLPEKNRPHFATMYFHEVDSAGHNFGQDSPQLIEAINQVDASIARLTQKLSQLPFEVNLVIVSDHGMAQQQANHFEKLPSTLTEQYQVIGGGPIAHLYQKKPNNTQLAQTVNQLNQQAKHFQCYQYQDIPAHLHANQSQRIGDISCLANIGWSIGLKAHTAVGDHGWDQFKTNDMDGIFYAKGPAFKRNYSQETAENIHIMPLLAHILGITVPKDIDGKQSVLAPMLK